MTVPYPFRGLGVLGAGYMGRALVKALINQGVDRSQIKAAETCVTAARAVRDEFGVDVSAEGASFFPGVDSVVLAVKPQDMAQALQVMRPELERYRPLVISIAAGLTVSRLQQWCGADVPIIRAMPNRPAMVGAGVTGLYAPTGFDNTLKARAEAILGAAGSVVWVEDEALMDVVTAVSGSGPAYFFRFAEALAAAGRLQGLSESTARQLAQATLRGAGMMASSDADLSALRASVTSRGGTTAAALDVIETRGIQAMVEAAVIAAVNRGRELSADAEKRS